MRGIIRAGSRQMYVAILLVIYQSFTSLATNFSATPLYNTLRSTYEYRQTYSIVQRHTGDIALAPTCCSSHTHRAENNSKAWSPEFSTQWPAARRWIRRQRSPRAVVRALSVAVSHLGIRRPDGEDRERARPGTLSRWKHSHKIEVLFLLRLPVVQLPLPAVSSYSQ